MTDQKSATEKETVRDFHHWIVVARTIVHDSFTGDEKELQRMTMHAAEALMLDHRLSAIETQLADITSASKDKE